MKLKAILFFILLATFTCYSQNPIETTQQKSRKGTFYFYWGWNISWYSDSDIEFTGSGNDFTLSNVEAQDRPESFGYAKYFKIGNVTKPQYNARLGYFFHENYNVSLGFDHMKYVVDNNQTVQISGTIENSGTDYDGTYNGEDVVIEEGFLRFEHTDGLNYINTEVRRFDEVWSIHKNIKLNLTEGLGIGMLYPKTNTNLLANERYDDFHIAGYGVHAVAGVNVTFWDHFFIQSEFKGGFINMPDIRTTNNPNDRASQNFWFSQWNWVFGYAFNPFDAKNKED